MPDIQIVIQDIVPRTTSGGKPIYDVIAADGVERAVWEAPLANALAAAATAAQGQPLWVRVYESQKGQYTNRSIQAFAPLGETLPPDQPRGGRGGGGGGGRGMSDEDKTRIAKMAAQGTAAHLVGPLFAGAGPDALDDVLALHRKVTIELYKEARSHEGKTKGGGDKPAGLMGTGKITPTATTPAEVAAQVGGGLVQVGVGAQQDAAAEAPDTEPDWT